MPNHKKTNLPTTKFQQHPIKSILFFLLLLFGVLLSVVEILLRLNGFQAGIIGKPVGFKTIDSLYLYKEYTADKNGVLKYAPKTGLLIDSLLKTGNLTKPYDVHRLNLAPSVQKMLLEFGQLDDSISYENAFTHFIEQLLKKNPAQHTSLDSAYLKYARSPINADGFRSIECKPYPTAKKSILLLGDSFLWGGSATPLTSSFADCLAAEGYAVYNTGIISADPAQYAFLAQQYIPKLKPDVVIVNFFMGNDVVWWKRDCKPYQFPHYPTNAGFLQADPRKEYLPDHQTTYRYIQSRQTIPQQSSNWWNRFCAATVLGTKIWTLLRNYGFILGASPEFEAYERRNQGCRADFPVSEMYLEEIQQVCKKNGTRFIVAIIPDLRQSNPHNRPYPPATLFKNVPFHEPPNLTPADYRPLPDGHFNNEGHGKYAEFLLQLIENE